MAVLSVSATILFVVLFVGVASVDLSSFAKKTKQNIPTEIFQKIYGPNFKDDNDIKNAVKNGLPEFGKEFGVKVPDKVIKEITEGALALKDQTKYRPDLFFSFYSNPIAKLLREKGILNDDNEDKLAKKYADIVKEFAKKVKKPNLVDTLPAVAGALGKFLKDVGLDKSASNQVFEYMVAVLPKN